MALLLAVRAALPRAARAGAAAAAAGGRPASTTAAAAAAETLARAWATGEWITSSAEYPPAPASVSELYDVHLALAEHPLVSSALGGVAGYKVGAVGAEGETCIYAPLFGRFIVDAPGSDLSFAAIQMHQVEPEFAVPSPDNLYVRSKSFNLPLFSGSICDIYLNPWSRSDWQRTCRRGPTAPHTELSRSGRRGASSRCRSAWSAAVSEALTRSWRTRFSPLFLWFSIEKCPFS